MAGLLYLPRIFVYHSEASHESQKGVFKTMERKLYNYIMMPAIKLNGFERFSRRELSQKKILKINSSMKTTKKIKRK